MSSEEKTPLEEAYDKAFNDLMLKDGLDISWPKPSIGQVEYKHPTKDELLDKLK